MKINTDATLDNNSRRSSISVLNRDAKRNNQFARALRSSPFIAKLLALKKGAKLAFKKGFQKSFLKVIVYKPLRRNILAGTYLLQV